MTIAPLDLQQMAPGQRAALLYQYARSELSDRLWCAALGEPAGDDTAPASTFGTGSLGIEGMMALLRNARPTAAPPSGGDAGSAEDQNAAPAAPDQPATTVGVGALGANQRYQTDLTSAAARTGIPAPALAAIINAESAKGADGSWLAFSRNTRSSAAGLGQFLSGTWVGMAEMKGSWLNATAQARGWLAPDGHVSCAARSALLSLRYEPSASIHTIADYARFNLDGLRKRGVAIGSDVTSIARTAYVGHYLGLGDAARFLTGELDQSRARTLLGVQIGDAKAQARIAQAGSPAAAHRAWFMDHLRNNLRPEQFAG